MCSKRNPTPPNDQPLNLSDLDIAAFHARVARAGNDECWLWLGGKLSSGHGQFFSRENRFLIRASRVALELDGRGPPHGLFACHYCDTPSCVNPAHLRWDTPNANSLDAKIRSRMAAGERHGRSKLTNAQTVEYVCRYLRGEPSHTIQNVVGAAQIRLLASKYRRGIMPEQIAAMIRANLTA